MNEELGPLAVLGAASAGVWWFGLRGRDEAQAVTKTWRDDPTLGIDIPNPEKPLFLSPKISITVAARDVLAEAGDDPRSFLDRHFYGDWGDLDAHDKAMNDEALKTKDRILSVYRTSQGRRFYIITDPDHETTTILLPEEY